MTEEQYRVENQQPVQGQVVGKDNEEQYRVENQQPVQGQVVGKDNKVYQYFILGSSQGKPPNPKKIWKNKLLIIPFLAVGLIIIAPLFFFFGLSPFFPKGKSQPSPETVSTLQSSQTTGTGASDTKQDDRVAVFTFLKDFCTQLQLGKYQVLFDKFTTKSYRSYNPDAKGDFGFPDKGGIKQCVFPPQNSIVLIEPLHDATDCVINLTPQAASPFKHKYFLQKIKGAWEIAYEGSPKPNDANCGNFP